MAVKEYLGLGWILCLSQLTSAAVPLFTENGGVNLKSGYQDLYLAGLLPMTGKWPGGTAMMTAAKMALVRINSREDVLPKYRLNLVYGDTEVRLHHFTFKGHGTNSSKIHLIKQGCKTGNSHL